MLAVILTIIKIVGFILLCVLALLLLAVLLILFVPVRYHVRAAYDERPLGNATVSWLFHLVSFRAAYEEGFTWALRVLGINVFRKRPEGEAGEKESEIPLRMEESPPKNADPEREKEEAEEESRQEVRKEAREEAEEEYEEQTAFEDKAAEDERLEHPESELDATEAKERRTDAKVLREWDKAEELGEELREESPLRFFRPDIQGFLRSIKAFFVRIGNFIEDRVRYLRVELWEAAIKRRDWLVWFLTDPANLETYHLLWRQLKKLLNHIKPDKLEGDVKFGFDDPYLTGQVLVAISPFYPLYGEHISVTPIFGESLAEGRISMAGRVRVFTVLEVIVRMLLNKNFRYLLGRFLNS